MKRIILSELGENIFLKPLTFMYVFTYIYISKTANTMALKIKEVKKGYKFTIDGITYRVDIIEAERVRGYAPLGMRGLVKWVNKSELC